MRERRDGQNYHDPEWPPVARVDPNLVQERIEEMARDEMLSAHPNFRAWLADVDSRDIAALVSTLLDSLWNKRDEVKRGEALKQAADLLYDYTQHRAADEWDRIALRVSL